MSGAGEFFGKYIGILGVITVLLVVGYIVAPYADVILPPGYTEITLLVVGGYVGKNGIPAAQAARSRVIDPGG